MPRKSKAALSIVAKQRIDGRARPPAGLTADQRKLWERVTATEPADLFATEATRLLLKNYCRHQTAADFFSGQLDASMALAAMPEAQRPDGSSPLTFKEMDSLASMRARETQAALTVATKLRLTNQSRYNPQNRDTAARRMAQANMANEDSKPWHVSA